MNSSVISWMSSPPVMANSFVSMDEWDNHTVDNFVDDFGGVAFGQLDFDNYCASPRGCNSNNNSFYVSSSGVMEERHPDDTNNNNMLRQTSPADNYAQYSYRQAADYPDQDSSSAPIILSFGNHRGVNAMHEEHVVVPEMFVPQGSSYSGIAAEEATTVIASNNNSNKVQTTKKKTRVRPPSQTYDHIIAERRRREQLSQLFVALSALVPGLKKMDKGSVLEDAIKYLKHLKERVQTLEEIAERNGKGSAHVFVRKSVVVVDDEGSDDDEERMSVDQPLPDIEVRVSENQVLIRVHCERRRGALVKLLSKVESLNMNVVSTNATPFGNLTIDITVIAELEKEFNFTVKEIAISLREALQDDGDVENM